MAFAHHENKLFEKIIIFEGELVNGKDINDYLVEHKEKYLDLVGIEFPNNLAEPVENHGAIFFNNGNYRGQIQISISEGKLRVTYGISKNGITP